MISSASPRIGRWILSATASAAARGLQKNSPDDREAKNSENGSHEPQIEPHVAVENVAELVADDALQFVARQKFHAAARDGDGRVAGFVAGGEGVDAVLVVHDINLRHGHAGRDGHFLDDVEQLAFVGVGRVRLTSRAPIISETALPPAAAPWFCNCCRSK
jgi:hypothetical protein